MIYNEIFNEMFFSFEIVCKVFIYRFVVEGFEIKCYMVNLILFFGFVILCFVLFLGFFFFFMLYYLCIILD